MKTATRKTRKPAAKKQSETRGKLRKYTPSCKMPIATVLRGLPAEHVQRLRRRIVDLIECVYIPAFDSRTAETRFAYEPSESVATMERERLAALSSTDGARGRRKQSLSADEERDLFERFNFYRHRCMKLMRKFEGKRLTADATRELLQWDEALFATREEIVQANLGLIPTMVERSRVTGVDFGELISEGQLALLRSIDKFDVSRGFKFSTYACRAILTSITRAVALMARYRAQFPTEYDPDLQRGDWVETRRAGVEEDCLSELSLVLKQNDAELTETEQQVLSERFGLDEQDRAIDRPNKTLRQVAEVFGVTKERVRQVQNRALEKLRSTLAQRVFAQ